MGCCYSTAFIDAVRAVAARADRGESNTDGFPGYDTYSGHIFATHDVEGTRPSLARVMLGKADYTFSDGPALLDAPWRVGEDFATGDPD